MKNYLIIGIAVILFLIPLPNIITIGLFIALASLVSSTETGNKIKSFFLEILKNLAPQEHSFKNGLLYSIGMALSIAVLLIFPMSNIVAIAVFVSGIACACKTSEALYNSFIKLFENINLTSQIQIFRPQESNVFRDLVNNAYTSFSATVKEFIGNIYTSKNK